ncbi:MAG: response regulator [Armatimonadetes bacterium]|nr:response regulator [Armatimonadota bacterium]
MIRVVISEVNPGAAEGLRTELINQVSGQEQVEVVGYARDGLEVAQLAAQLRPDLLFIDENMPGIDGYEACRLASAAAPDSVCIVLCDGDLPVAIEKGMRAGARAVVKRDVAPAKLGELVTQLAQLRKVKQSDQYAIVTDPARLPVTVAITSAKGGVGKTTIAANLAVLFAKRFPGQVVLVDFYGQFGDVALALDLRPENNIGDLVNYGSLDADLVETHLVKHETSLRVLSGVGRGQQQLVTAIDVPHLAELCGLLRLKYRFVFFDMPPVLWTASTYIMSRCNEIIIVSNTIDLATLRDTTALLEAIMATHIPKERIHLLANRVSRQNQFTVRDLEEATGFQVVSQLPDDPQTAMGSYNEGKPFVLTSPNAPVTQGLHKLMDRLLEGVAT